jgi:hypothetical protein
MEGWAYERSYRHEDYDDVGDMLADGIDIDDIPESYYTKGNKQRSISKLTKFTPTEPDEEEGTPF